MKNTLAIIIATLAGAILASPLAALTDPVGTVFTYQGRLVHNGEPVADPVNLTFRLYATATGGAPLGVLMANGFEVGDDGFFTIDLDFGEGAFTGAPRWLEIVVNSTTLSPRQPIMAAPYAMVATTAANVPAKAVAGVYGGITGVGTLNSLNVSGDAYFAGQLGIGTALPASSLDILSFTAGFDGIWNRTTGVNSKSFYGYQAGSVLGQHLLDAEDNNWRLRLGTTSTGMTDRLVVNAANGNVGIGTNAPTAKLDIVGNIFATASGSIPVRGVKTSTGTFPGVQGESESTSSNASGVRGYINSASPGSGSAGVRGHNFSTTTNGYGVRGNHEGGGVGVFGKAVGGGGRGVVGVASATGGASWGVHGETASSSGRGVYGSTTATSGAATGVYGSSGSTLGRGVEGFASHMTGTNYGVLGTSWSADGYGVYGNNTNAEGIGVHGTSRWGVVGISSVGGALSTGVRGSSTTAQGAGVFGLVTAGGGSSAAILAWNGDGPGWGGLFFGSVKVNGSLFATDKFFLIDNPANPDEEYLVHSCVESDEMKNLYDGVVTLDAFGEAVVTLPDWFEHLNADFRYQLTCVSGYAPIYIAQELADGAFVIAGEGPRAIGLKVSWQITGNRIDPAARDSGFRNVIPKPEGERGKLLYPAGYDRPVTDRIERMANPMPGRQPSNGIAPLIGAPISTLADEPRTSTEAADL